MDDRAVLALTTAERLSLADFFESLSAAEWRADSLCAGWTVHDVAAHLTLSTRTTLGMVVRGAIRARGSFDRMELTFATERAARYSPAELVTQLRGTAASAHRTLGAGIVDPLLDALVHGQDVARPLGRVREMPAEAAVIALEHVLKSKFYGAQKRLRNTRLVATDYPWSGGSGALELRGSLADLILTATGRPAGLAALYGSALPSVTSALT
ncbi:maleylpyruvate isomerase family mycothiol-dependent enzyme [Kribbella sp. NPDC051770]|uniref:maleylpyruvate isomerase family mycothiol-dependent enzyme n=1 Tax=Kribbella sp. NPDC051770 TaxID=3155413 RepID=UPI0034490AD3